VSWRSVCSRSLIACPMFQMTLQILLPADFREEHRQIVLAYLLRGHEFNRNEWRRAIVAFDLLKNGVVMTPAGMLPFPLIYRQYVEDSYANLFIEKLFEAGPVEPTSTKLWSRIARQIPTDLIQANLYQPVNPATRLILAYCLYWWRSFTLGYALEIEIQRDLQQSGIRFETHDLLKREERLSPYDIAVLGFRGDIKTSLYFLQAARSQRLAHDFYITKVSTSGRKRIMVVFMQQGMWHKINGETFLVLLEQIAETLPQAARIVHEGLELTVIDYDTWKEKVRQQQKKEDNDGTHPDN
jgi:hypothetical protein